ncbi:MAG: alkaline shock response membrane anchor protein AmaP [Actinomycetota bacterium]|nr:alkaline shock response membrane anchor protein AmaP [Actinomycetota bacterium]
MSTTLLPSSEEQSTEGEAKAQPMSAAKRPVAAGLLSVLGVVWALLLLALAVVCLRDALVAFGALGGRPWINSVTSWLDGTTATNWMYLIGAVCVLVGLLLLVAALKPRARRGIEVEADTGVLISKSAVRRLASSAARQVDGVDTASATAGRRRVTVDATILASSQVDEVKADISDAVGDRLEALRKDPQVRVRARASGGRQ